MNYINHLFDSSIIEALGWTIVHSIWQISLWALVAVIILILTHKRKANVRYIFLVAILVGICSSSVVTFKRHYNGFKHQQVSLVNQTVQIEGQNNIASGNAVLPTAEHIEAEEMSTVRKSLSWFKDYFEAHLPGIVSIYFLVFVFLFIRYLGSFAWLMRLKGTSTMAAEKYQELIYKYGSMLNLSRIVRLKTSIKTKMPVVLGHFRPIILVPVSVLTGLDREQLKSVLLHELAHIKRNDFIVNLIHGFVEVVFFYHPVIWWLSDSIRTEREHACDDLALKEGANAKTFAHTLAELAEKHLPKPQLSPAFSGNKHKVKQRIHRLIQKEKMKTNLNQKVIVALGIILAATALSFSIRKDIEYQIENEANNPVSNNSVNDVLINTGLSEQYESVEMHGTILITKKNGLLGIVDTQGNVILPNEYEDIEIDENLIFTKKNGLLGIVDLTGKVILANEYEDIEIDEYLILTKKKGLIGIVDLQGNEILPNEYEDLEFEGNLIITKKNGLLGISNLQGDEILPNKFDELELNQELQLTQKEIDNEIQNQITILVANIERRLDELIDKCVQLEIEGTTAFGSYFDTELNKIIAEEYRNTVESNIPKNSQDEFEDKFDKAIEQFISSKENDIENRAQAAENIANQDDDEGGHTLILLMKKGADEWNAYRENHPGENFDEALKESNLTGMDLSNFNLVNMNLKEATLVNVNFTNAIMTNVNIKEADAREAIFEKADLTGANMKELVLRSINLKGAVLVNANLKEITLIGCDLRGADLRGTNLHEAIIKDCKFKGAIVNHNTLLPPNFDWNTEGIRFE